MALTPALAPYLLYALGQLAVGAVVLRVDPHRPAHRAFAVLVAARGGAALLGVMAAAAEDPAAEVYWRAVEAYLALPVAILVAAFVGVYPRRRRWVPAKAPIAPFLLAAAAVDLAFALDHALLWGDAGPLGTTGFRGPLWPLTGLYALAFAAAALRFSLDAARAGPGPARSPLLVALGFALVPLFDGLLYVASLRGEPFLAAWLRALGLLGVAPAPAAFQEGLLWYAAVELAYVLGAAVALASVGVVGARLGATPAGRREALRFAVLPALAVASVGVVAASPDPLREPMQVAWLGVWRLAQPALVAYGMLRHQLFDVDLKVKRGLQRATVAAAFLLTFTAVSVGARAVLPGPVGDALGALAAGSLILVLLPLQRVGAAVAEAALPGVGDGSGYLEAKRHEVYRAALEEALPDQGEGAPGPGDSRVLAALRGRLGISDREHARLHAEVLAARGLGPTAPRPGARFLGKYRVEAALGGGGFGLAYLAVDERVGRRVVLKTARAPSAEEAQRLLREGRTLARLEHPHIVAVHDVEVVGADVVLVLAYLEGGSLADRLASGPLPPAEAARIVGHALAGLEAAHARGILHRDVKPANILLDREGRALLADFGVAQDRGGGSGTVAGLSLAGTHPGSVRYMSPEQVRGLPLDVRSDLYSVGVVLYEALAGRPYLPLEGLAEFDLRLAILEAQPRLPLPGVPRALNDLLRDALAKDPRDRPPSAAAMRQRLEAATRGRRP